MIDTKWIPRHVPREKWVQYEALARETELTPAALREWYQYVARRVPSGLEIYLCVAPAPSSGSELFFYAHRVAEAAFGENYRRYLRVAVPGTLDLGADGWTLCASPPDATGSLTVTDLVELPVPPAWREEQSEASRQETPPDSPARCAVCGTPVQGRRYCTRACRQKAYRQRQALRRADAVPAEQGEAVAEHGHPSPANPLLPSENA